MKLNSFFVLNFDLNTQIYYDLLIEEDYDFKTKNITFEIIKLDEKQLKVSIFANSIIDLKIANSAFIKSLEIITKSLNV